MDASKRWWSILPVYISASRWFWSFWQGHCFFKNGVRTDTVPFSPAASTGCNLSFLACHGQWPESLLLAMTLLFFCCHSELLSAVISTATFTPGPHYAAITAAVAAASVPSTTNADIGCFCFTVQLLLSASATTAAIVSMTLPVHGPP